MAFRDEDLKVTVSLDSKGAISGLDALGKEITELGNESDKTKGQVGDLEKGMTGLASESGKVSSAVENAGGGFSKFGASIVVAQSALTLLSQAFQVAKGAFDQFVTQFAEAEQAQIKLEKTLGLLSGRVNNSADQWSAYADSLEKATGADADYLKSLVSTNLLAGKSEKQTQALIEASIKLSEITGNDLVSSVTALQMSQTGVIRGTLKTLDATKDLTEEQLRNDGAINSLNTAYKNLGTTFKSSTSGAILEFSNAFGDLSEAIGGFVAKVFGIENGLRGLADVLRNLAKFINEVAEAWDWSEIVEEIKTVGLALAVAFAASNFGAIVTFITVTAPAFVAAFGSMAGAVGLLNAAFIPQIALFGAIFIAVDLLIRNMGKLDDIFSLVMQSLELAAVEAVAGISRAFEGLLGFINANALARSFGRTATEMEARSKRLQTSISNISKGLDAGIIGKAVNGVSSLFNTVNNEGAKAAVTLGDLSTQTGAGDNDGVNPNTNMVQGGASEAAKQNTSELVRLTEEWTKALTDTQNTMAKVGKTAAEIVQYEYEQRDLALRTAAEKDRLNKIDIANIEKKTQLAIFLNKQLAYETENLKYKNDIDALFKKRSDLLLKAEYLTTAQKEKQLAIDGDIVAIAEIQEQKAIDNIIAIQTNLNLTNQMLSDSLDYLIAQKDELEQTAKTQGFITQAESDRLNALGTEIDTMRQLKVIEDEYYEAQSKSVEVLLERQAILKDIAIQAAAEQKAAQNIGQASNLLGTNSGDVMNAAKTFLPPEAFSEATAALSGEIGASLAAGANVVGLALKAPDLIKGLAAFIDKLTNFPALLAEAFQALSRSFANMINNRSAIFAKAIPQIIDAVIQIMVDFIPKIPSVLIDSIYVIIESLINAMPKIVAAFLEYTFLGLPKMIVFIVAAIIKAIPRVIKSLFVAMKNFIPVIFETIKDAIMGIGDTIADMFSTNIADNITSGVGPAIQSISTGLTSQLFSVAEMSAVTGAAQKADEMGESIRKGARDAFTIFERLGNWFKKIWSEYIFPFFDLLVIQPLKAVWEIAKIIFEVLINAWSGMFQVAGSILLGAVLVFRSLWDSVKIIFDGIINAFSLAWEGVKSIFNSLWEAGKVIFNAPIAAFETLWKFVSTVFDNPIAAFKTLWNDLKNIGTNIFNALAGVGATVWNAIKSQLDNAGNVFSSIGSKIGGAISGAITGVISSLKSAFTNLNLGDAARRTGEEIAKPFRAVFDFIKPAINTFIDVLNGLRLPKVDVGGKVLGQSFGFTLIPEIDLIPGTIARFAKGGMVEGSGFGDTVPALLTPGEFVIKRSAVANIGERALSAMNSGQAMGSNVSNISVNLTLNASERIDPAYIKDKIMPTLREELRRESRRGGYIIAAAGVRS